jgi:DNA mismatch endonuclease (patch repair protein)
MTKRPPASSPDARRRMQAARQRDTAPELAVRRILHSEGMRFRVDYLVIPKLRRRADIVFTKAKVAVFVDGCFWHSCPEHRTFPKANAAWWADKLRTNRRRDAETDRTLLKEGWRVVRVWEHESAGEAAARIIAALRACRTPRRRRSASFRRR